MGSDNQLNTKYLRYGRDIMRIFFTAVGLVFALSLAKKEKLLRMVKLLEFIACYYYKYHPT